MSAAHPVLQLALCSRCGAYSFPAQCYGCRRCGAAAGDLSAVACPQAPRLLNFVTVHAELAPGLPVPCVIGEVQLAPGVVEEALLGVVDEGGLHLGMALQPQPYEADGATRWRFLPAGEAA